MLFERAYGWDLDSTLSDTSQRRPLLDRVKASEATWEDYSLASEHDEPRVAARVLMQQLARPGAWHIVVSGRSSVAEGLTWRWLHNHGFPVTRLMLKPPGQDIAEFKIESVEKIKAEGNLVMFFEDWASLAQAIRERTGVPVLTINPEYPDMCTCGYANG